MIVFRRFTATVPFVLGTLLFGACAVLVAQGKPAQTKSAGKPAAFAWSDSTLSPDVRADMVVKQLTLAEKIQLVHGIGWGPLRAGAFVPVGNNGGAGEVQGIPRLGIPDLQQADSAVGVRMAAPESRYATLLPSVLGAAARGMQTRRIFMAT
jgi:beta-glucosidase